MRPLYHTASSALIGGLLYLFFRSWGMAFGCFLSGVFIDLDHVYDYIREFGLPFKVQEFVSAVRNDKIPKLTFVFHSWELVLLFGAIAFFTGWKWAAGIMIGFGHHILLDKLGNGERLRAYSFIWRWRQGFEFDKVFPGLAKKKRGAE